MARTRSQTKSSNTKTTTNGRYHDDDDDDDDKYNKKTEKLSSYDEGTNYVAGGIEADPYLFALIAVSPFLTLLLAYLTSPEFSSSDVDQQQHHSPPYLTSMLGQCFQDGLQGCITSVYQAGISVTPTIDKAFQIKTKNSWIKFSTPKIILKE